MARCTTCGRYVDEAKIVGGECPHCSEPIPPAGAERIGQVAGKRTHIPVQPEERAAELWAEFTPEGREAFERGIDELSQDQRWLLMLDLAFPDLSDADLAKWLYHARRHPVYSPPYAGPDEVPSRNAVKQARYNLRKKFRRLLPESWQAKWKVYRDRPNAKTPRSKVPTTESLVGDPDIIDGLTKAFRIGRADDVRAAKTFLGDWPDPPEKSAK